MNRKHLCPSRIVILTALAVASGCVADRSVRTNQPPVAHAGDDLQLDYEGEPIRVRLDGRDSEDPDGRVAQYLWRSGDDAPDGGAPPSALDPEDVARPELVLERGSYRFTLWVRDDDGAASTPDSVSVRIGTDPIAECEGNLPTQFQNGCGSCVCGVGDACRQAAAACDGPCWDLIACISEHCADPSDFACITGACADLLGGGTAAMGLANAGCFEPCTDACAPAAGLDAG